MAAVFLLLLALLVGAGVLVEWAFDRDQRNAETECAQYGAEPHYTYRTNYICVTPDGRVVP